MHDPQAELIPTRHVGANFDENLDHFNVSLVGCIMKGAETICESNLVNPSMQAIVKILIAHISFLNS